MTNNELYDSMTALAQQTAKSLRDEYGFSSVLILGSTETDGGESIIIHVGAGSSLTRCGLAQHYLTTQDELDRLTVRQRHGD